LQFIGASVEPTLMIITELLEGCSLHKYLESIYPNALSLEQSLSFALDISQAMEYLHANGIIHRDLKPGNPFFLFLITMVIMISVYTMCYLNVFTSFVVYLSSLKFSMSVDTDQLRAYCKLSIFISLPNN